MKKLLKYGLFGLGGIVALLLLVVAIITATFNPNDYKPLIVKLVKDKKERTLNIEGDSERRKTAFAHALAWALDFPHCIYHDFTDQHPPLPDLILNPIKNLLPCKVPR